MKRHRLRTARTSSRENKKAGHVSPAVYASEPNRPLIRGFLWTTRSLPLKPGAESAGRDQRPARPMLFGTRHHSVRPFMDWRLAKLLPPVRRICFLRCQNWM